MEKNLLNSGLVSFEPSNRYHLPSEAESRINEFVNGNKRKVINVEDALQQKMAPIRNKDGELTPSHSNSGKDNGKSFPCPDCHKSFATEVDLKAHLMRHITQHPYVCLACGKGFKYEHTLDFHIKSQHGAEGGGSSNMKNIGQRLIRSNKKEQQQQQQQQKEPLTPTSEPSWTSLPKSLKNIQKEPEHTKQKIKAFVEDKNNNNNNSLTIGNMALGSNPTITTPTTTAGISDLGFPPTFPPRSIQIKSEKVLISMLEGVHPLTEQTYTFYKCSLCGFAFPSLEPVSIHVQSMHSNQNQNSTCDKCGATFKWRSELQLHEQLHKAMEEQQNKAAFKSSPTTSTAPSFFTPNDLVLMNPMFSSDVKSVEKMRMDLEKSLDNQGLNLCTNARSKRSNSGEADGIMKGIDPKAELSSFSYNMIPAPIPQAVGDIEETAPGQFKCRFCDKTFDRIFSVHRHERVHTGYKPCICKVCGRGFSEKRNLRHHIIRFHSDGSGRELLRRVRKTGTAASFLKKAAVRLLTNNLSQQFQNEELENIDQESMDSSSNMDTLPSNNNNGNDGNGSSIRDSIGAGAIMDNKSPVNYEQKSGFGQAKGSSSRRKSKPTKKMVLNMDEACSEDEELRSDEETDLSPGELVGSASSSSSGQVLQEKANEEAIKLENETKKEEAGEGQGQDQKNGAGWLLKKDPEAESKMLCHGAFFSSYNPRLGIVEKPIKRHEACRPQVGPDGKFLYPCGYCHKTFCSLSDLNRHMNFHEDVRPFKCQFCDYQSRTNSQLKVHMLRHAGIKQYLCQICNYNGVTQSDLNRHNKTRSHLLRSENVCPLCSLGFSTRTLLSEHVLKFHETSSSINILAKVQESQNKKEAAESCINSESKNTTPNTN